MVASNDELISIDIARVCAHETMWICKLVIRGLKIRNWILYTSFEVTYNGYRWLISKMLEKLIKFDHETKKIEKF